MATATATSTVSKVRTASAPHTTFISGTRRCAAPTALTSRSVTEIRTSAAAFTSARSASSRSARSVARR